MELGAFSISLAVKDIEASKRFYEELGFSAVGGNESDNWLIMRSASTTLGLFQGMFEKNILTFNPGWDANANELAEFTDIREIQNQLLAAGIVLQSRADSETEGPASFMLEDPDGNMIMVDQHR